VKTKVPVHPFNTSSSAMQQLLAPAVVLTLVPNVKSPSLNARTFLISEAILLQLLQKKYNGSGFDRLKCCTSFFTSSYKIAPWLCDINVTLAGRLVDSVLWHRHRKGYCHAPFLPAEWTLRTEPRGSTKKVSVYSACQQTRVDQTFNTNVSVSD